MVSYICIFEKGPRKLGKHALHDLADSEDTVELLERSHTRAGLTVKCHRPFALCCFCTLAVTSCRKDTAWYSPFEKL